MIQNPYPILDHHKDSIIKKQRNKEKKDTVLSFKNLAVYRGHKKTCNI